MCGITGVWSPTTSPEQARAAVTRMVSGLRHRGPDGEGIWCNPSGHLILGHRRLSVFDLSDAAQQPMVSASGRNVLCFNGEIYNFLELRENLARRGLELRSQSDTEVLLELLSRDGVEATLPRLQGMFAFAFWQSDLRKLVLVRDAFGKKPLLYALDSHGLQFASELGALHQNLTGAARSLDTDTAQSMLAFGVPPEPDSILSGVRKLPPGHIMELSCEASGFLAGNIWRWYRSHTTSDTHAQNPLKQFDALFTHAVRQRLAADVPVGAFLSGGIDSSLVAAKAQSLLNRPLKTFTIGFETEGYDEASYAEQVAQHLRTEHRVLRLSAEDMEEACMAASSWFDEPFADASAIPTRLLAQMAREEVTVALTGDGGDESFLGYTLHRRNTGVVSAIARIPYGLRAALAFPLGGNRKARWLASALKQVDTSSFYFGQRTGGFPLPAAQLQALAERLPDLASRCTDAEWLGACDMNTYLVDDMLTKVDRATMSVGLEARSPLLARSIVEFAQGLPLETKFRGGFGKALLRDALSGYFPTHFFERKKSGFRAPIGYWLNRPQLRDWSHAHAVAFDARFGWRTKQGFSATALWTQNANQPGRYGRDLWRLCQLMDWSTRHGV